MKKAVLWMEQNIEELILVLLLSAMTMIMGVQVCARYVFNSSLSWTEEITRYLFIWSGFISISYCTKRGISIRMSAFLTIVQKRTRERFELAATVILLLFSMYFLLYSISYLRLTIECNQVSPAIGLPMYYVQAAPFVGFLLQTIRVIQLLIRQCKRERGEL